MPEPMTREERAEKRRRAEIARHAEYRAGAVNRAREEASHCGELYRALGMPFGDDYGGWACWTEVHELLIQREAEQGGGLFRFYSETRPSVQLRALRALLSDRGELRRLEAFGNARGWHRSKYSAPFRIRTPRYLAAPSALELGFEDHPAAALLRAVQALLMENAEAVEALSRTAPLELFQVRREWNEALADPCNLNRRRDALRDAAQEVGTQVGPERAAA